MSERQLHRRVRQIAIEIIKKDPVVSHPLAAQVALKCGLAGWSQDFAVPRGAPGDWRGSIGGTGLGPSKRIYEVFVAFQRTSLKSHHQRGISRSKNSVNGAV